MKTFLFILFSTVYIFSQCSDAGICSISGQNAGETKDFTFSLSYLYGYSGKDDDIKYSSAILDAKYNYAVRSYIYLSLPYNNQSGPLGSVSGTGDIIILGSQEIYNTDEFNLSLQGGLKLAAASDNEKSLPQRYQSGLGSNDILLGVSAGYMNLYASAGYQIAGKRNNNFQQVERGNDLLLSIGYSRELAAALMGSVEFLLIKRLSETSIVNPVIPGTYINVPESDNLQINGALTLKYRISEFAGLQFFGAVPFRKRPVNIDGLTRSLSVSAGINLFI